MCFVFIFASWFLAIRVSQVGHVVGVVPRKTAHIPAYNGQRMSRTDYVLATQDAEPKVCPVCVLSQHPHPYSKRLLDIN